ncbi:HIT family protein [Tessaracoccus caeni]|uniref:HIT family protein n=1 Tax=Tessaracoccus caeni TaxID=3031239 RepID=UPI0023D9C15D|nr:HIT domain-containing protein [Tessaracoccus caeni]MDF1488004.1 HIT domain-containing protein [Tessaracoccus caeni]
MDCLFCAIVDGTIPSRRVYEDDVAYAFLDISPWQRGHTLVVPKRHSVDVLEDDLVLAEIAPAVARVGRLLKEKLGAAACNVLSSAGAVSGQEIFHSHVHVVPRYADAPGLRNLFARSEHDLEQVLTALKAG